MDGAIVFRGRSAIQLATEENVEFGLRRAGFPWLSAYIVIDNIRLVGLGVRAPSLISSPVACASACDRVLANDPAILLMDEPFRRSTRA